MRKKFFWPETIIKKQNIQLTELVELLLLLLHQGEEGRKGCPFISESGCRLELLKIYE